MSLIAISATVSSMTIAAEEAAMQPGTILFKISESAAPNELKGLNALLKAQGLVSSTTMKGSALTVANDHRSQMPESSQGTFAKSTPAAASSGVALPV